MRLSRGWKWAVGIATGWVMVYPVVWVGAGIGLLLGVVLASVRDTLDSPWPVVVFFLVFMPLQFVTVFLQMGLSLFYLVHVIKNQEGAESVRVILGVSMRLMPYIAMSIYYLVYILPEPAARVGARAAPDR